MRYTESHIKTFCAKQQKPSPPQGDVPHAWAFTFKKKPVFYIPFYFVNELNSQNKKAFAVWLKLKSAYNDTKITKYTVAKTQQRTNISPYLLRKYIPILLDNGWAKFIGDDLVLVAFKKMFNRSGNNIYIKQTGSVQDIIDEINFSFVEKDYTQQRFMADVGLGRLKAERKRTYKKYYCKSRCQHETITSYRRIAGRCNVSLSTAHRLVGKWIGEKKMWMQTQFVVLDNDFKKSYKPHMTESGLVRVSEGALILIQGSRFGMLQ